MTLTDYLLSPFFFIIKSLYFWNTILCACMLSHFSSVWLFVTLWTVAHQAPLSKGFSRKEYWSGLSWPPPGYLPNPGIEPRSPTLQADSLPLVPPGKPDTSLHLAKILHLPSSLESAASLVAQPVKNTPAMQETQVQFMVRKIPWRRDWLSTPVFLGFSCNLAGKESSCNAGDLGLIPALGRSPGEGNGYSLQHSGLENSMIVHGVAKSRTLLSNFHTTWNYMWSLWINY